MGSGIIQQADREEGWIPQWDTLLQEANAASRKATGNHNWADKVIPELKGC